MKIVRQWVLIGILICFPGKHVFATDLNAVQPQSGFANLTIVVNSCDKYEELWEPFFKILFLQWPALASNDIPIVLISNKKTFNHPRVTVFQSGEEHSWSDTFKRALDTVKTDYVLYLQDDYFIRKIDLNKLERALALMEARQAGYLQLSYITHLEREMLDEELGIAYKQPFEAWRTSLQAALWDKRVFAHLLNPSERIWDFEIQGSMRSQGTMQAFLLSNQNVIDYYNMAAEGRLIDKFLEAVKQEYGVTWARSLPLDSTFSWKRLLRKEVYPLLYYKIALPVYDGVMGLLKGIVKE